MPNVCKANGSSINNANVCFSYGTSATSFNNGRVTSMTDSVGSESYSYDMYGNVTQLAKVIGTTTYTTGYAFNLANQLTQITYPSGRAVAQNVDTLGRLTSVVGTLNSVQTTYASGFAYNTAQQTSALKYGNNVYASFGFAADTLFLQCLDYSTTNRSSCAHDATTKFGLNNSFPASPANNGHIASTTDAVDTGRSTAYTYDSLYRLTNAVTTGSTAYPKWGLSDTYDRYGNRTAQAISSGCTGITCPTNSVTVSTTTNRITGSPYTYDLSGNMTNDGQNTLTYDGENRNTAATNGASSGVYYYDGNGVRAKKTSIINSTANTTVYVFSATKVIAEYDNGAAASAPSREYIYAGGQMLAKIDSSGTKYYHQDHLSNRLVTDSSGNTVSQSGHFPFGESWYNGSNDKLVFTSYERDAESGNDYATARSYVSRLGRFSSADRLVGSILNPQSLNRFSYVLNNAINLIDPLGLCADDSDPEFCPDVFEPGGWSDGILGPGSTVGTYNCITSIGNGLCATSTGTAPGVGYGTPPPMLPIPDPVGPVGSDGNGKGSGGGGGNSSIIKLILTQYCFAVPSGEVRSVGGSLGTVGGVTGAIDVVTNFTSGQTTVFRTGGGFAGFNSELTGQISYGTIRGELGPDNSKFAGTFYGGTVSARGPGVYASVAGVSGPYVTGVSYGTGLPFGSSNFSGNRTVSVPVTSAANNPWLNTLPASTPWFTLFHLLRKPCKP